MIIIEIVSKQSLQCVDIVLKTFRIQKNENSRKELTRYQVFWEVKCLLIYIYSF